MEARAIEKAEIRLHAMRRALCDMEAPSTPLEFSSDWYVFVVAANGVYEVLKKGAEHMAQGKAWVNEEIVGPCESDELLKFMFEARNDEEHGLSKSVKNDQIFSGVWAGAGLGSGSVFSTVKIDENGHHQVIESHSTFPEGQWGISDKHAMVLASVSRKGGKVYPPPQSHRGSQLVDKSPANVAKLTYVHLEALVKRASALNQPKAPYA